MLSNVRCFFFSGGQLHLLEVDAILIKNSTNCLLLLFNKVHTGCLALAAWSTVELSNNASGSKEY